MKTYFKSLSLFVASILKPLLALPITFSIAGTLSSCDEEDDDAPM